jgi:hypothetical protein
VSQTGHSGRYRFDRLIEFSIPSRQKSADDRRGAVTKFANAINRGLAMPATP